MHLQIEHNDAFGSKFGLLYTSTRYMVTTLISPTNVGGTLALEIINMGHNRCLVMVEMMWVKGMGSFA